MENRFLCELSIESALAAYWLDEEIPKLFLSVADHAAGVPDRTVIHRNLAPKTRWTDSRLARHLVADSGQTVRTVVLKKYRVFPQKYAAVCRPLNFRRTRRKLLRSKEFVAPRRDLL